MRRAVPLPIKTAKFISHRIIPRGVSRSMIRSYTTAAPFQGAPLQPRKELHQRDPAAHIRDRRPQGRHLRSSIPPAELFLPTPTDQEAHPGAAVLLPGQEARPLLSQEVRPPAADPHRVRHRARPRPVQEADRLLRRLLPDRILHPRAADPLPPEATTGSRTAGAPEAGLPEAAAAQAAPEARGRKNRKRIKSRATTEKSRNVPTVKGVAPVLHLPRSLSFLS